MNKRLVARETYVVFIGKHIKHAFTNVRDAEQYAEDMSFENNIRIVAIDLY